MKKSLILLTVILVVGFAVFGWSMEEHEGHLSASEKTDSKSHDMKDTFKYEMVVEGIRAEFEVMSLASMGMTPQDGKTHHIMVKFFHNDMNHQVKEAIGKIKVIPPSGSDEIGTLENYSGIFAANFSFEESGKYGVICLVKIDGKKYTYKFWYAHE